MAGGANTLEKNLAMLAVRSPRAAAAIRQAVPAAINWQEGKGGAPTGTVGSPPRQLASLREPLAEAEKFAASIDISSAACVVVRGFGLGHHIAALARRLRDHGAIMVFEPDIALLRAVFDKIDCTAWLGMSNLTLLADPDDTGAIAAAASGIEAVLSAGTTLVDHVPSRARLGAASERFAQSFTAVMKAVRTNVVTTLVQVDVTVSNVLLNLPWYATVPGVGDLAGVCRGKPAVIVSAGPSLRRNIDLLSRPGVRDRVVIIAVQTVLKTLLSKGIRPHFVTALDYHEISRRFYEGLTAADVEGVTLVAEPKCNRAILEAFPGAVRCPSDHVLEQVLGAKLLRPMGDLTPGATVAHLAYYLARQLGCDPVILIGQDLGFTDGQYYAPGAAIHQVWSSELSEFRTLEMLEWERIVRMRSLLRKVPAQGGGEVYTDEQMSTYLVQFERDFMHDVGRGLTTIDATEGGVLKQHTKIMGLHEALERHARGDAIKLPSTPARLGPERLELIDARLKELGTSTRVIERLGREAQGVLEQMLERQSDHAAMDRLISKTQTLGQKAVAESAYWLVQYINQTGQFNRYRADRAIHIDPGLSAVERQRKEIERDIINVRWLGDAAAHVRELLDEAKSRLQTAPVVATGGAECAVATKANVGCMNEKAAKVWAAIFVDPTISGLSTPRDLSRPFLAGRNPLQLTLGRLARCKGLEGVILLTPEPAAVESLIGAATGLPRIEIEQIDASTLRERTRRIGLARLWSRHCWRGGIANISCFDESLAPSLLAPVLERRGLDAAVLVGADWCLVDPALVDTVVDRYLERPDTNQLTFTQAPPGLGACLVSTHVLRELAAAATPLATIGGLLGYIPLAPQGDPIAKPACVMVEPHVRDLLARCIPDSAGRAAGLAGALAGLEDTITTASASDIARAIAAAPDGPCFGPEVIVIDSNNAPDIQTLVSVASSGEDLALTVIDHGGCATVGLIEAARRAGIAGIHVRTMAADRPDIKPLIAAGADVISIDMGTDANQARPWNGESPFNGLPHPWIVPRLTRCDATREAIEQFYDQALMTAGACVIDPLSAPGSGERIDPLPVPATVRSRLKQSTIVIAAAPARLPAPLKLAS